MTERTEGGTCHNDKPSHLKGSRGEDVWYGYFLPFPLAAGAKIAGGGVEERSSLPLGLPFPLPDP